MPWLPGYPATEPGSYCAELLSPGLELIVLKCYEEPSRPCHHQVAQKYEVAFTVLGVISLVFLLLTFYVYISLPDLYNLHGKIVLSNVVSAFLVTLYLIIVFNIIPSESIFCLVLGYLVSASCPHPHPSEFDRIHISPKNCWTIPLIFQFAPRATLPVLPCSPGCLFSALTSVGHSALQHHQTGNSLDLKCWG